MFRALAKPPGLRYMAALPMNRFPAALALALWLPALAVHAAAPTPTPPPPSSATPPPVPRDDAVRLQIFLDGTNFGPGKIDGRYGGFTKLSWRHYQRAQGATPGDAFDVHRPDLAAIAPLYLSYVITPEDLGSLGPMPKEVPDQAKLKSLPYADLLELVGERFHVSRKFLAELNPHVDWETLKAGAAVTVPNVAKPFYLGSVLAQRQADIDVKKQQDAARKRALSPADPTLPPLAPAAPAPPAFDVAQRWAHISVKDSYLELHEGEKIIAAFPITPGSTSIPSPKGEWRVESKTLMPEFRWDKAMLMEGRRSKEFFQLPPGPNNPVGICWIALNKPGIGLHGTPDPDTIGRSASHGCIRLANWDVFKVYYLVDKKMRVVIE